METQAPYLTESKNQYVPWVERGETELEYYKRLYLEVTTQNAELERDLDETRRLFDTVAEVAFHALQNNYALGALLIDDAGENHETLI